MDSLTEVFWQLHMNLQILLILHENFGHKLSFRGSEPATLKTVSSTCNVCRDVCTSLNINWMTFTEYFCENRVTMILKTHQHMHTNYKHHVIICSELWRLNLVTIATTDHMPITWPMYKKPSKNSSTKHVTWLQKQQLTFKPLNMRNLFPILPGIFLPFNTNARSYSTQQWHSQSIKCHSGGNEYCIQCAARHNVHIMSSDILTDGKIKVLTVTFD